MTRSILNPSRRAITRVTGGLGVLFLSAWLSACSLPNSEGSLPTTTGKPDLPPPPSAAEQAAGSQILANLEANGVDLTAFGGYEAGNRNEKCINAEGGLSGYVLAGDTAVRLEEQRVGDESLINVQGFASPEENEILNRAAMRNGNTAFRGQWITTGEIDPITKEEIYRAINNQSAQYIVEPNAEPDTTGDRQNPCDKVPGYHPNGTVNIYDVDR